MQSGGDARDYRQSLIASLYIIIVAGITISWTVFSPTPGWVFAALFAFALLAAKFFAPSIRQRYRYGALALLAIVAGQVLAPLDYFSLQHIVFNLPFVSAYLFPRIWVGALLGLTSATLAILALLNAGLPASSYWEPIVGLLLLSPLCHSLSFVFQKFINEKRELQAMTAALSRQNDELSRTLHTLELAQSQLVRQEKMASMGQLAAGIVHEINTPVTFITTNIEMLEHYFTTICEALNRHRQPLGKLAGDTGLSRKEEADHVLERVLDDYRGLFEDTIHGLERLNTIVKGMRLFTHSGPENTTSSYDLAEGLESALLLAHNEIKRCAVVEKRIETLPAIEAFGGEINQVLLNLLLNAAQAIAAKGQGGIGVIRISAWSDPAHIYCAIEDNGVGIASQNLGKIFDPFFTTKPPGQGTGLGLSISYNIVVNHHQGDITVESTEGEGTKFVIKLPVKQEVEPSGPHNARRV